MALTPHDFSNVRVERPIAAVRVALAATSLFAVWLDPAEPARNVVLTYNLHASYLAYALVVAAFMWRRSTSGVWPMATLVADIGAASVFQYLTTGPSSPFFVYFVFSLFCAALRWGWRSTVRTAVVVLITFVTISFALTRTLGATEFELNRFVIRFMYLIMVTVLLVYLGQHEARLRADIQRLARWPLVRAGESRNAAPNVLEHAAGIIGAGRATVVWDGDDEPWVYVASWSASGFITGKHAPTELDPVVPPQLDDAAIVCADALTCDALSIVSRTGTLEEWRGLPVHPALVPRLLGTGFASAPFRTESVSGRVFFTDLPTSTVELLPLLEVLGREIGASLDQLHAYERSQQLAVIEDRIRLARDLHDGVLQALTGIRLELQSMAAEPVSAPQKADRLLALERALAIEQRELRCFIQDLRPSAATAQTGSLSDRLDELRKRIALEWKAPITVRVSPMSFLMPPAVDHAIPFMVHEGIVNALKHGHPSRVTVDVQVTDRVVRIVVSDDGGGFPQVGRFDHAALVRSNGGPISLRERVAALGGEMVIDSSGAGARVEMSLPLGAHV